MEFFSGRQFGGPYKAEIRIRQNEDLTTLPSNFSKQMLKWYLCWHSHKILPGQYEMLSDPAGSSASQLLGIHRESQSSFFFSHCLILCVPLSLQSRGLRNPKDLEAILSSSLISYVSLKKLLSWVSFSSPAKREIKNFFGAVGRNENINPIGRTAQNWS